MMWCYCYHLHGISNLRDLTLEDNLNNTFCNKKQLQTTTAVRNCHKFNKKVSNSIYKFKKKIESPLKIKNDKTLNFCKWYS